MEIVGQVTDYVVTLLGVVPPQDRNIYFADSNRAHMEQSHPEDFAKFGDRLSDILHHPDYVGQNPKDGSIEYVKEFLVENEYVKVEVRLSRSERFFARTLYVLNRNRVRNFIAKGTLKPLQSPENGV